MAEDDFFGAAIAEIEARYGGSVESEDIQTLRNKNPEDVNSYLAALADKQERREASTSHRVGDSQNEDQSTYRDPRTERGYQGPAPDPWAPTYGGGSTSQVPPIMTPQQITAYLTNLFGPRKEDTYVPGPDGRVPGDQGRGDSTNQDYIQDALDRGIPKSWIDDFIRRNPGDYHRIVDAYGGGGRAPGAPVPPVPKLPPTPPPGTPGGGGSPNGGGTGAPFPTYPGAGGSSIPPDLFNLRNVLGDILAKNVWSGTAPQYPGSLSLNMAPEAKAAYDKFVSQGDWAQQNFRQADSDITDLLRKDSFVDPTALASLRGMSETGGAPDITSALEAIRTRSMMQLEDEKAAIREKFGNWGLGHSSDVNEYLGRGVSRGVADMNAQQTQLVASVMNEAAGRKLSAAGTLGSFGQQDAATRAGLVGLRKDLTSAASQAGGMQASGMMQFAQSDLDLRTQNLSREYSQWYESSRPYLLNEALSYATGFPPVKPAIPNAGGNGAQIAGAAIGGGSSILTAMIIAGMLSDRNAKYDIRPVAADDVLERMSSLPIHTWKYKGDTTPHIGPMAQDFQATFGVGDGRHIHPIDVIGVVLASQKALAAKYVGRGRTEGARRG